MKQFFAALAIVVLGAVPAMAVSPTAEQIADFHQTCVKISGNETLCSCKADAAMTLVDADFMDIIIKSMKGAAPPPAYDIAYSDYIAASTRACGMGGA